MLNDKLLHALAGLAISYAASSAHVLAGPPAAAFIGRLKEGYDRRHPTAHTYDGWDAFATVAGGLPGQWLASAFPAPLLLKLVLMALG